MTPDNKNECWRAEDTAAQEPEAPRESCRVEAAAAAVHRKRLERVSEELILDCSKAGCHTHVGFEPIPSRQAVIEIVERVRELLFPGSSAPTRSTR